MATLSYGGCLLLENIVVRKRRLLLVLNLIK